MTDVVVICPDTNIELSVDAPKRTAIRGGKSAIVKLAAAWARAGHRVTVFSGRVHAGSDTGLSVRPLAEIGGTFDVAIYVTGALGHFRELAHARPRAKVNIFWINGPHRVEPPDFVPIDWIIAPAKFLARRAIDEWGLPAGRVIVIPGDAVVERWPDELGRTRDPSRAFFACHPNKGLDEAVAVLGRCRPEQPCTLDVYGTGAFWGAPVEDRFPASDWLRLMGDVSADQIARAMNSYGFMPFFTDWLDSFSTVTAEAMAGGAVVFATAHGATAELVRHGWNGFLVRVVDGRPDLAQAEDLLRNYLRDPSKFDFVRENARRSVATWDEVAAQWARVWER
jgi:glycosyltransferase involved in cell wall biosynthesis